MQQINWCPSCGGMLGRDCFNPEECAMIAQEMQRRAEEEAEYRRELQAEQDRPARREQPIMPKQKKPSKRLTFRRQKPETGLAAVGHPNPDVDIKHDGKIVGLISASDWRQRYWSFGVMVQDKSDPDGFGWTFFANKFDSEQAARDYITSKAGYLLGLGLFHMEPEELA